MASEEPQQRGEDLEDRLLVFASRIGKVVDALPDTRLGRHIAGQLVRAEPHRLRIIRRHVLQKASETSFISWELHSKNCGNQEPGSS